MRRLIRRVEYDENNRFYMLIHNLINTVFGFIESLLFVRVLLRLFGANTQNRFVDFIYSVSDFFIRPFRNIFENVEIAKGMFLEINTLIAMIVYALLAWIIISIFISLTDKRTKTSITDVE